MWEKIARVIFIASGVLAIVGALTARVFFAGAMGIRYPESKNPVWFGRLLAVSVGSLFLYVGLVGSLPSLLLRVLSVGFGAIVILFARQPAKSALSDSISADDSPVLTLPPRAKMHERIPRWVWRIAYGLFFILGGLFARR
jgi:hypothetical protein